MGRWEKAEEQHLWLPPGEIIADPMADFFPTQDGKLSVYLVEDSRPILDRVVAALAAIRQGLDKFEYGLMELEVLENMGFKTEVSPGDTPDMKVNEWHVNLIELSTRRILDLTHIFYERSVPNMLRRVYKPDVQELLLKSNEMFFDPNKVTQPNIRKFLGL